MPTKPTKLPEWASTDVVDGTSGQNNVEEPSEAKKDIGWSRQEKPNRQWWNWLWRQAYLCFDWLFGTTIPLSLDAGTANEQLADGTGHTHAINGASKVEAEAGTDNEKVMTPIRTFEAIEGYRPDVTDFTKVYREYKLSNDQQANTGVDITTVLPEYTGGAFPTIGPTGSGADYEWEALDLIPAWAKVITIRGQSYGVDLAGGPVDLSLRIGQESSLFDTLVTRAFFDVDGTGATQTQARDVGSADVILENDRRFLIRWDSLAAATGNEIFIYLESFGA